MNSKQRRKAERAQRFSGEPQASTSAQQPSGPGSPQQAAPITPLSGDSEKKLVVRTASVSVVMPMAVYNGRLRHPDPIIAQFGGWRGPAIYRLMQQENLALSADCSQWEDRVNKDNQRVRPGIKGDKESEDMAAAAAGAFRELLNPNIINLWMLRSRWYGFVPIGVAGWEKRNGLLAPFDLYNVDPWNFKFGPNFEPFLLTQFDMTNGVPVDESDFIFARWGSLFTAYGESDLRDVYLEIWFQQNVRELLLQSIEIGGMAIPWVLVPETMEQSEFDAFERSLAKKFKHYVLFKSSGVSKPEFEYPAQSITANGAAGKSELDYTRFSGGNVSRKILGTQQTQDRTGGSRALEDTRMEIANDKTPPALQFVNNLWTKYYLDRISLANWPKRDRSKWPVMASVALPSALTPQASAEMSNLLNALRMKEMTPKAVTLALIRSGHFEAEEADDIVTDTLKEMKEKGFLSTTPSVPRTHLPPANGNANQGASA